MQKYANNMQKYAIKYAEICKNKDSFSKNMQKSKQLTIPQVAQQRETSRTSLRTTKVLLQFSRAQALYGVSLARGQRLSAANANRRPPKLLTPRTFDQCPLVTAARAGAGPGQARDR